MSLDVGRELERRAHRLLWHLGYFARRNVFIYSDDEDQVTDIDVIGIKFDDTLSHRIILVETKSEKGFSSILKLRGLLEYYSSDAAYMIRPNVTPAIVRFAEQLGIRAMHTSRLDEMEKELGIGAKDWTLSFSPDFDRNFLSLLKILWKTGYKKEILLRDAFWIEGNPFHKLKLFKDTIQNLQKDGSRDPSAKFPLAALSIDLTSLFSAGLLQSAGTLYSLPEHQRRPVFLDKLVSGRLTSKEKEELLDKTYSFIMKYTKTVLNAPLTIRKEDFSLTPEYSDQLYNLLTRIMKKSQNSKDLPRLFDIYLSIYVLGKRPELLDLQGFLNLSKDEFEYTLKFARDAVYFLFNGKIPEFLQPLMTE